MDKIPDLVPASADQQFFPRLRSGSFADIGPRRYMEDEHILIDDLSSHLGSLSNFPKPNAFYGVIYCFGLVTPMTLNLVDSLLGAYCG